MRLKYAFAVPVVVLVSIVALAGLTAMTYYRTRRVTALRSVDAFGPLKLGDKMPSAGPGDFTFAPYRTIPASKFYALAVQDDHWCIQAGCSIDGALVRTMGGWLQGETPRNYPDLPGLVGLDKAENEKVESLVIIGDREGRITGIYPNRGIGDVIPILKLHPDLADFSLLPGVDAFGPLKVGDASPLQPGDPIAQISEELKKRGVSHIPAGKAFYLFSLEKRKYDMVGMYELYENTYGCIPKAGCRYSEPDPPHDFLFAIIDELGGWFLANDEGNEAMMRLFGLAPEDVANGKVSLVVLTDARGIIVDLHPGKTLSDSLTILSQHPELADVQRWYRN